MSFPNLNDCIVAIASGAAPAPLGIIRLSGGDARRIAGAVVASADSVHHLRGGFGSDAASPPLTSAHTRPVLLRVFGRQHVPADLFEFSAPRSYTGQDVVEIHTVGAPPLLQAICDELVARGARRALPGEFTARAYLAGKLDARQIDGVYSLLRAGSERDAKAAARLASGEYGRAIERLRSDVLDLLALVEAGIDFVEEDISFVTASEIQARLREFRAAAETLIGVGRQKPRAGLPHVLLLGLPNAGKSTLFNALLGHSRAIVSPVAGTTRDVLSAEWDCGGVRVVLQDSAGDEAASHVRASADGAGLGGAAADARARAAVGADLILWVHASDTAWGEGELSVLREAMSGRRVVIVVSKADVSPIAAHQWLPPDSKCAVSEAQAQSGALHYVLQAIPVCAVSGAGLSELTVAVAAAMQASNEVHGVSGFGAMEVAGALDRLEQLVRSPGAVQSPELVALELRHLLSCIGEADGAELTETVLGRIFSGFCIGK